MAQDQGTGGAVPGGFADVAALYAALNASEAACKLATEKAAQEVQAALKRADKAETRIGAERMISYAILFVGGLLILILAVIPHLTDRC
ncbi:hypothetical protein RNZ50_18200 [Paracoccaceae bacterium Fryx2]|nr:hypothetical protein [Paracoccaceae bacterium Fryx2]